MAEENGSQEAGISTPLGSVSFKGKRMAEFIAILSLCLLFLLAYVLWEHKAEARTDAANLAGVLKEMTVAQHSMVQAQREQNCLLSLPPEKREREYFSSNSFCKQISR